MNNKITTTVVLLLTTLSLTAQIDSIAISDLESRLSKQFSQQEASFNEELLEIRALQNNSLESTLIELSTITKSQKAIQLKLDGLLQVQALSQEKTLELERQISSLKNQLNTKVNDLKIKTNELDATTNTLSVGLTNTENSVVAVTQTSSNNANSITTVNEALSQKQQYGLIFLGLFLILVLAVYATLTKRQNTDTKKLAKKQQEIFEKQIQDGQQLADWLSNQTTNSLGKSAGGEVDHSFAKRVADEIVRITTNLSRMDASIKGHKQLSASVRKLEQSLNSNSYELEVLLNKPYDNGMNLQANFVTDENLKEGESVITRIIKPQINYKGKLIQAAQVEVSQGE